MCDGNKQAGSRTNWLAGWLVVVGASVRTTERSSKWLLFIFTSRSHSHSHFSLSLQLSPPASPTLCVCSHSHHSGAPERCSRLPKHDLLRAVANFLLTDEHCVVLYF
ncbi:hypothetical protein GQ42DRAFT_53345 [Ramicandelaber brevisporus]|nr:hypothetical protein GQ42DRAFT_53345 [Ramicandelaber brevisporus]